MDWQANGSYPRENSPDRGQGIEETQTLSQDHIQTERLLYLRLVQSRVLVISTSAGIHGTAVVVLPAIQMVGGFTSSTEDSIEVDQLATDPTARNFVTGSNIMNPLYMLSTKAYTETSIESSEKDPGEPPQFPQFMGLTQKRIVQGLSYQNLGSLTAHV